MRRDHVFNSEWNTRGPERTPADQRENCALRFISRAQTAVATEVGVRGEKSAAYGKRRLRWGRRRRVPKKPTLLELAGQTPFEQRVLHDNAEQMILNFFLFERRVIVRPGRSALQARVLHFSRDGTRGRSNVGQYCFRVRLRAKSYGTLQSQVMLKNVFQRVRTARPTSPCLDPVRQTFYWAGAHAPVTLNVQRPYRLQSIRPIPDFLS